MICIIDYDKSQKKFELLLPVFTEWGAKTKSFFGFV